MGLIFGIFYFVLILPMRNKQKKLESQVKALKTGDKVIINPGIFGVIVGVEDDAFQVRIDDKTRIKVLKSAIAGLQGRPRNGEEVGCLPRSRTPSSSGSSSRVALGGPRLRLPAHGAAGAGRRSTGRS